MELRQLRYLVALADERHFTRAALRCHVAQPALSQQIGKLEGELGVALVERTTRRVALTGAGEALVARARRVLAELDAADAELQQLTGLLAGRLTIGITQTPGPFDLLPLLRRFHRSHPGVELAVREGLSTDLADELRAGALDVALLSRLPAAGRERLTLQPLASEPLVAVLPPAHRLAGRRRIDLGELRAEPFVVFHDGATIREAVAAAALAAGFAPRVAFEIQEVGRTRAVVSAGLGVAVLPRSDATAPGPRVAVAELRPRLRHEIALATRADGAHTPAAQALLALAAAG
ncbi:LysR substrate-binding domain-containing protein [Conexibacter sp. JD483]|uniref:LysR family transcriptional regulator n=1 Tax=unclassified Conexibacter TaxID=2627773 RepID=UPI00272418E9|nr:MULTISPECIES: LysR substrate-binding domain-containing protein [unclassified Conexibacter]MDO8186051.1 LysR substrate-binding domain-containing protein [Conexibacter sp. CPCC 205706]MDO8199541.1 LysR substrate-binding domain-containing protein [Conexibacter sp. CPCC 205762]MDR9368924.1 LysR substrate-binding domain-containing protein [Conexibacter sp. JD483]